MKASALLLAVVSCVLSALAFATRTEAQTVIYLDFDSHSEMSYGSVGPISVPAFQGGNALQQEIERRVAEDLAPFDVVLTTTAPANIDQGFAYGIRAVIGGSFYDLGGRSGLATDPLQQNVVWAVEHNSQGLPLSAREIAGTVSHELAHAFGHIALDLASGNLMAYLSHYHAAPNPSNPLARADHNLLSQGKTQILGGPRGSIYRDIWWTHPWVAKGFRVGGNVLDPNDWTWAWQDDILSLAAVLGLRDDDHGDTPTTGSRMLPYSGMLGSLETGVEGSGIVEMNARSWPGLCPPTPRWLSCPEDGEYPGPEGQGVVLAVQKDFFRFDATAASSNNGQPWLEVTVETLDGATNGSAGNLDSDLEVWFDDPAAGWVEITAQGLRTDSPTDRWARWADSRTTTLLGQYAVAVKSAGEYGDLGGYRVIARGKNGLVVEPPESAFAAGGGLRARDSQISRLIDRLVELRRQDEVVALLGRVADVGVGLAVAEAEAGKQVPPRKETAGLIDGALRQTSVLRVIDGLIDWASVTPKESAQLREGLERAIDTIELEPRLPRQPETEAPRAKPVQLQGADADLICDSELVVY